MTNHFAMLLPHVPWCSLQLYINACHTKKNITKMLLYHMILILILTLLSSLWKKKGKILSPTHLVLGGVHLKKKKLNMISIFKLIPSHRKTSFLLVLNDGVNVNITVTLNFAVILGSCPKQVPPGVKSCPKSLFHLGAC